MGVYEIAGKSPRESVGDSEDAPILEPSEEMQGDFTDALATYRTCECVCEVWLRTSKPFSR